MIPGTDQQPLAPVKVRCLLRTDGEQSILFAPCPSSLEGGGHEWTPLVYTGWASRPLSVQLALPLFCLLHAHLGHSVLPLTDPPARLSAARGQALDELLDAINGDAPSLTPDEAVELEPADVFRAALDVMKLDRSDPVVRVRIVAAATLALTTDGRSF